MGSGTSECRAVEAALNVNPGDFICVQHHRCKPELLKRVQDGLLKSKQTPNKITEHSRKAWNI